MTWYPPEHYTKNTPYRLTDVPSQLSAREIEDNRKKALRALDQAFVSGQPKVCGSFTRKDFDGKMECCATPLFAVALGLMPNLEFWHLASYTAVTDASRAVSRLLDTPEEKIFTFSDHTNSFSDTAFVLQAYWDMPKWVT
jgi:hypothetical protein